MRIMILAACFALLFLSGGSARADAPDLLAGVYIQDGLSPLAVDRHSAPEVVDWNNDGAKDLVVGQFGYGYIWLFLNQGTDSSPVFNGGAYIEANNSPIMANAG